MRQFAVLMCVISLLALPGCGQAQTPIEDVDATERPQFEALGLQGLGAKSVAPDSLIVWAHGFGSNGLDFVSMSDELSRVLPDTVFLFPNAPNVERNNGAQSGYSWFEFAGGNAEQSRMEAAEYLFGKVRKAQTAYDIPDDRIIVAGFSQGGGASVTTATCIESDIGFVVVMGGVVDKVCDANGDPIDVLFVHMRGDPQVPLAWAETGAGLIEDAGHGVNLSLYDGDTHWPSEEALNEVKQAIVDNLR